MEKARPRLRRFTLIKNVSIPARLHAAGALALVGLLVTGGAGYIGLTQSNEGLLASGVATSAVLYQKHADMMHDALRADVLFALRAGPDAPAQTRTGIQDDLAAHVKDFSDSIVSLRALDLDDATRQEVVAVLPALQAYLQSAQEIVGLALSNAEAGQAKWDTFMASFSVLEVAMGALGESIEKTGADAGAKAHQRNLTLINVLLGALSACVVVMLTSNFLLARSITQPIRRVKEAIEAVVAGNLGGRRSSFDRASDLKDEVSQIAEHLEFLRVKLREAIEMEAEIKRTQEAQHVVVSALTVGLENLSQGKLTQTLDEAFTTEYESLRGNFNATVERLNQTISQVAKASRSIKSRATRSEA